MTGFQTWPPFSTTHADVPITWFGPVCLAGTLKGKPKGQSPGLEAALGSK